MYVNPLYMIIVKSFSVASIFRGEIWDVTFISIYMKKPAVSISIFQFSLSIFLVLKDAFRNLNFIMCINNQVRKSRYQEENQCKRFSITPIFSYHYYDYYDDFLLLLVVFKLSWQGIIQACLEK